MAKQVTFKFFSCGPAGGGGSHLSVGVPRGDDRSLTTLTSTTPVPVPTAKTPESSGRVLEEAMMGLPSSGPASRSSVPSQEFLLMAMPPTLMASSPPDSAVVGLGVSGGSAGAEPRRGRSHESSDRSAS